MPPIRQVAFERIARAALARAPQVAVAFAPDGRRVGAEWVARNPTRADRHAGSFKINLSTGRWGDFATGDTGGDLVALAAYVTGLSQREAAVRLAESLCVDAFE